MTWQRVSLDHLLVALESGSRPPGGASTVAGGVPSIGGEHLDDFGGFRFEPVKYIPESHYRSMSKGIIRLHDILVVKDGATTGKTSLVRQDFPFDQSSVNEHVFIVRVDERIVDPRYVFYLLFSARGKAEMLKDHRGATIGGISRGFTSLVNVPLAPPSEQRRIAEILDEADRLRRLSVEANAVAGRIVPTLYIEMFGDPATNSKGWDTRPLGELCLHVTSGSRGWSRYTGSGCAQFLRTQDIVGGEIAVGLLALDPPGGAEAERTRLQDGDVAVTITGMVGKAATFRARERDVYVSQHVALVRPDPLQLCSDFLTSYANLPLGEVPVLARFQYGQTKPGLGFKELTNSLIPLPSMELQAEFSARLTSLRVIQRRRSDAHARISRLWEVLLLRAFAGDLTATWRQAHMKELLSELEQQAKTLAVPVRAD
jgi:type I restriction enzyme S subunit